MKLVEIVGSALEQASRIGGALEDKGFSQIATKATKKDGTPDIDEKKLLSDAGLFGVHMAVAGVGMAALSQYTAAGRDLFKLGAIVAASMYGMKYLAENTK